jgi:hypothetical protein
MKTLKVIGILALGAGVIVLGGIALGLVASLLHVVVPLAVIFGVGYLAYHLFFAGKEGKPDEEKKDDPERDAKKDAGKSSERKTDASESTAQPKGPMTEAEALRQFEEHRKKLQQ